MAKRRVKKRTHAGAKPAAPGMGGHHTAAALASETKAPKSMVIRINAGEVGPSISQLVRDTRLMMEPGTASRLKERKSNKLRDFVTMAGPLGVTHLMLFSRSDAGNTNLRICTTPRGPTLHFRVEKYSLCKDVQKSMRRPKGQNGAEYLTSPLLVMNNFMQSDKLQDAAKDTKSDSNPIPKNLESLTTTIFQSLFAPISPHTTSLKTIKRVMLLDRKPANDPNDPHAFVLQLRHYAINAVTPKSALPKALRKLEQADHLKRGDSSRLPNLGALDDVADYLLDPTASGFTTASDTEADTDAEIEVLAVENRKAMSKEERQRIRDAQRAKVTGANAEGVNPEGAARPTPQPRKSKTQKKAIKLQELGPRMTLRLTKVEEGLCGGKVLWHEYISKSKEEQKQQDKAWEIKNKEKAERRRIQKENVERKKKEKKARGEEVDDEDDEMLDDEDFDDDVWHEDADAGADDDDEEGEEEESEDDEDEDME
ncbi:Brix-domain-containing protein, partial [Aureobasidium melanogenum]